MSLGDTGSVGQLQRRRASARRSARSVAAGVTYVAAAGNSTVDASTFIPAAFPEVIAVSALTDLDGEPGGHGGCWLVLHLLRRHARRVQQLRRRRRRDRARAPRSTPTGPAAATQTEDGHEHGRAARRRRGGARPGGQPDASRRPTSRQLLKATGECPNGAARRRRRRRLRRARASGANDPDGIAEPLVNALRRGPGRRSLATTGPTVQITNPTDGSTVVRRRDRDRDRDRRHRRRQGRLLRQRRRSPSTDSERVERLVDAPGTRARSRPAVHAQGHRDRHGRPQTATDHGHGPGRRERPGRLGRHATAPTATSWPAGTARARSRQPAGRRDVHGLEQGVALQLGGADDRRARASRARTRPSAGRRPGTTRTRSGSG